MRTCYVCSRELSLDQFGVNRTKPEGRTLECRECRREYNRQWRERNRDKDRAASQRWREAHPEMARERVQVWRENNDRSAHDATYRERHADEIRINSRLSRARIAGAAIVEPVDIDRLLARDGGKCRLCSEPVDMDARPRSPLAPTVDHIIPLSKGGEHSYENTQIAHHRCNSGKKDRN